MESALESYVSSLTRSASSSQTTCTPENLIELFGNRTQSNPIELNRTIHCFRLGSEIEPKNLYESSIGFDFRTQSDLIELNVEITSLTDSANSVDLNRTESNPIKRSIGFDCVRLPKSIEPKRVIGFD